MRRLHVLGLAVFVAGLLGVGGATSASAIEPGQGHCVHVGVPFGNLENSGCDKPETNGPYLWCWYRASYSPTSPCSEQKATMEEWN